MHTKSKRMQANGAHRSNRRTRLLYEDAHETAAIMNVVWKEEKK